MTSSSKSYQYAKMEVQKGKGSLVTKYFFKGSYILSILKWFEAQKAHNP